MKEKKIYLVWFSKTYIRQKPSSRQKYLRSFGNYRTRFLSFYFAQAVNWPLQAHTLTAQGIWEGGPRLTCSLRSTINGTNSKNAEMDLNLELRYPLGFRLACSCPLLIVLPIPYSGGHSHAGGWGQWSSKNPLCPPSWQITDSIT